MLVQALEPVTANTGAPWWVPVATTFFGAVVAWLVKRQPVAGSRENAIIDQLQENLKSANDRIEKLESTVGNFQRRELVMYAYITQVHAHFAAGNPPPPPPLPQELFGTVSQTD